MSNLDPLGGTTSSTRYFTDEYSVWKFAPGEHPMHRSHDELGWEESGFCDFEEFEESPGDAYEITPENGEP